MAAVKQVEGPGLAFRAAAAIEKYALVTMDGTSTDGTPDVAVAVNTETGVLYQLAKKADAAGDGVTGIPLNQYSSYIMVADDTIAVGDTVHLSTGDNGRVMADSGAGASTVVGEAKTAAAQGEYVEVVPK